MQKYSSLADKWKEILNNNITTSTVYVLYCTQYNGVIVYGLHTVFYTWIY